MRRTRQTGPAPRLPARLTPTRRSGRTEFYQAHDGAGGAADSTGMAARRNKLVSMAFRGLVVAGILGLAAGVAGWLVTMRPRPVVSRPLRTAPRVLVMEARPVPVRRHWEGFGTARALDAADVPARVTATVIEKPPDIRPGRSVKRGDLLLQLDESDFLRQVEIATQALGDLDAQIERLDIEEQSWRKRTELMEDELRLAEAELARVRSAFQAGAAKQREIDIAEQAARAVHRAVVAAREELDKVAPRRASLLAQRHSQEAAQRLAVLDAERTRIQSPLDGVLAEVDVEEGENVAAGQRVARVVNLERIEVPLLLPASARAHLALGDPVLVTASGDPPHEYPAQLARIAPEDDASTRTMRVYVEIRQDPAERPLIAPGQFVQGLVMSGAEQERWVVPRRAVDGERVIVIDDGVVKGRDVDVEFELQGELPALHLPDRLWAVLKDPLPRGAFIVVDASRLLVEGSPARPIPAGGPEATGAAAAAPQGQPDRVPGASP